MENAPINQSQGWLPCLEPVGAECRVDPYGAKFMLLIRAPWAPHGLLEIPVTEEEATFVFNGATVPVESPTCLTMILRPGTGSVLIEHNGEVAAEVNICILKLGLKLARSRQQHSA